ncbi:hypothetical protein PLESTB_001129100 [Pleodorina starrii]|uniref:Uncharacterized protein n=1 Tax=Pleodorina starrii TaxID=330485 RepID=A0A9W6BR02_9CHLO|nr:hypothetical protein PLESTM_001366500 [Pleodorina starrii]GLC56634.1 hypothetical protein PLESTB_001129100 [Pleodorina starrii]
MALEGAQRILGLTTNPQIDSEPPAELSCFFLNPLAEGCHGEGQPIPYAGAAIFGPDAALHNPLAEEYNGDDDDDDDDAQRVIQQEVAGTAVQGSAGLLPRLLELPIGPLEELPPPPAPLQQQQQQPTAVVFRLSLPPILSPAASPDYCSRRARNNPNPAATAGVSGPSSPAPELSALEQDWSNGLLAAVVLAAGQHSAAAATVSAAVIPGGAPTSSLSSAGDAMEEVSRRSRRSTSVSISSSSCCCSCCDADSDGSYSSRSSTIGSTRSSRSNSSSSSTSNSSSSSSSSIVEGGGGNCISTGFSGSDAGSGGSGGSGGAANINNIHSSSCSSSSSWVLTGAPPCSISGLAMTRAIVRQLGLLPPGLLAADWADV